VTARRHYFRASQAAGLLTTPHHASLRSPTLPFGREFTRHSRSKQKRPPEGDLFCFMVEAAGGE